MRPLQQVAALLLSSITAFANGRDINGVQDGQAVALYLNGTFVASTPWSGLRRDGSAPVLIGGNLSGSGTLDLGRAFAGWLHVAHYSRALTPAEISNLYAAGPPR